SLALFHYPELRNRHRDRLRSRDSQVKSKALLSKSQRSRAYQLVDRSSPVGREEVEIARKRRCRRAPDIPPRPPPAPSSRLCSRRLAFAPDKPSLLRRKPRRRGGFPLRIWDPLSDTDVPSHRKHQAA